MNLRTKTYFMVTRGTNGDKSYNGLLFQAMSINYPLVAAKCVSSVDMCVWKDCIGKTITFNLKNVEIKRLSAQFVRALNTEKAQKEIDAGLALLRKIKRVNLLFDMAVELCRENTKARHENLDKMDRHWWSLFNPILWVRERYLRKESDRVFCEAEFQDNKYKILCAQLKIRLGKEKK